MADIEYRLHFKKSQPATFTRGDIYFIKDARPRIGVARSASVIDWYTGIADAALADNILTLTKADGQVITLDMSDVASAADVSTKLAVVAARLAQVEADIDDRPTTITVQQLIDAAVASVYRPKGSKQTYADLPTSGNKIGDVWNVVEPHTTPNGQTIAGGTNYLWTGTEWDALGGMLDMREYFKALAVNGSAVEVADGTLRFATSTTPGAISINGVAVPIASLASAAYQTASSFLAKITTPAPTAAPDKYVKLSAQRTTGVNGSTVELLATVTTASAAADATDDGLATAADVRQAIADAAGKNVWAEFEDTI